VIVRARFREADSAPSEATSAEARMLALAYVVEAAVEDGRFQSLAQVAEGLRLSRSRLSQVMRRRWAPVAVQEHVLGAQHPGESS
jgi:predicted XRE-type DNA-binding protein